MQSVAAVLVLPAFSGSYITALAAVAWQVQHAAMSSSLLVLLQLTVLMYLLSIGASEKSLHDSRSFLLFCQVPTSSPSSSRPCRRSARGKNKRACGPIYIYIYMYAAIHPSIHAYMHTYMHTTQLVHTQLTRTYSSTHNLLHTNPSPSLFPFLLSPCHLYLSFAACWKLTCGAIRSFNFYLGRFL